MLARSMDAGDARSFSSLVQEAEEAGERRHGWTAAKQQRRAASGAMQGNLAQLRRAEDSGGTAGMERTNGSSPMEPI